MASLFLVAFVVAITGLRCVQTVAKPSKFLPLELPFSSRRLSSDDAKQAVCFVRINSNGSEEA